MPEVVLKFPEGRYEGIGFLPFARYLYVLKKEYPPLRSILRKKIEIGRVALL